MPKRVWEPVYELLTNNPDKVWTVGAIAREVKLSGDQVKAAMYNARKRGTLELSDIETVSEGLSWRISSGNDAHRANDKHMLEELGPSKDGSRVVFQDENGGIWLAEQI